MSVRAAPKGVPGAPTGIAAAGATVTDVTDFADPLAEGNSYHVSNAENPLKRTLHVAIRATLNDLCLQRSKATWAPSAEALKAIFQQRKFTSLDGSSEAQGDLKAIVLHNLNVTHVKSTFPLSLGAKITGVDNSHFSATGTPFSTIVMPDSESHHTKKLQEDDVSLGKPLVSCILLPSTHLSVLPSSQRTSLPKSFPATLARTWRPRVCTPCRSAASRLSRPTTRSSPPSRRTRKSCSSARSP